MKLPVEYTEKMKTLLGPEFDDYLKSLDLPRACGLRANTLKISPKELKDLSDIELEEVKWCDTGFYFNPEERPSKNPLYYAGLYYIQEPSAMCAAGLLPVFPGDRVLDLCAAPGGKSTQAAAKLKGRGLIVANDISAGRCRALVKNIELCGVPNAVVSNEAPERLAEKFPGFFTKIIIDAPCSGEGMFRKDAEAVKSWSGHKSEVCTSLQRDILNNGAKMLAADGIMSYSTCTFSPEENEGMIDEFLKNHPEFELLEADKSLGFEKGRADMIKGGSKELEKCGRLFPHKVKGEGHFLALLHKKEGSPPAHVITVKSADKKFLKDFYDFCKSFLNFSPEGFFEIHGTSLFKIPLGVDFSGIRLKRSGLYLGELKKNRFEPSQAFAMTLEPDLVKNTISFPVGDKRIISYLKGESFVTGGNDGWNLVCIDKYPLGWGKVQKGRMKNKYLSGWLMQ
ncbi:MAG: RsmB/NOP family class I SAM-dependent RNA methyltransferase [Clostridiales bacterium]|nr:RsmB/NOP family class I SAM-dependent RNA methyltransferase [Clostridiales bacterium]